MMVLNLICVTLTLFILVLLQGMYKLSAVESIILKGDKSLAMKIVYRTIYGLLCGAMGSVEKLLEVRLDKIERDFCELVEALSLKEDQDIATEDNKNNVH